MEKTIRRTIAPLYSSVIGLLLWGGLGFFFGVVLGLVGTIFLELISKNKNN